MVHLSLDHSRAVNKIKMAQIGKPIAKVCQSIRRLFHFRATQARVVCRHNRTL